MRPGRGPRDRWRWISSTTSISTIRMAPPLTLSEAEAKEGLGLLTDALAAVNAEAATP